MDNIIETLFPSVKLGRGFVVFLSPLAKFESSLISIYIIDHRFVVSSYY